MFPLKDDNPTEIKPIVTISIIVLCIIIFLYHHIDNNFGPNPQKDIEIWNKEIPDNPETWQWTTADNLFLKLIEEVHNRDMKIIIDGVFNHSGIPFFALQDVKKNGKKSKYIDWFIINTFDDPKTEIDEFDYEGWSGIIDLPVYKEIDGLYHPELMDYFKNCSPYWREVNILYLQPEFNRTLIT